MPDYVHKGRNETVRAWLDGFTDEEIGADPLLALTAGHSNLAAGDLDAAQHWESSVRRALERSPSEDRRAALEAGVAILSAAGARDGLVQMGEDASRAYELEPEDSGWRAICCLLDGVARHLTGDLARAERRLEDGVRRGAIAAPHVQSLCLAQLALMGAGRGDWDTAAALCARARAQLDHYALGDYPTSALVFAVSALMRAHKGRIEEAHADLREARRLLEGLDGFTSWYDAETRLAVARATLSLGDVQCTRRLLAEVAPLLRRIPEATTLLAWRAELEGKADSVSSAALAGPALLTTAELRVLRFLPTHLSFREIAASIYVSANTVKTQAHAVYRKLDASSRSQAVTRATELGLLDL
jgi:LuxR family maltose regulon positive regulatory protein